MFVRPIAPLLCACVLLFAPAVTAQPYTVIELGAPPGETHVSPHDINNQLQVAVTVESGAAYLREPAGFRALGVVNLYPSTLEISNSGVVAGVRMVGGRRQPFVWIDGTVYQPPGPPDEIRNVSTLTDNGLLLMQSGPVIDPPARSWLLWGSNLYDVNAAVGGTAYAINDSGVIGGIAGSRPFLRLPDGRITTPWLANIPVTTIGPGGHFAGFITTPVVQREWYYGTPDGTVTRIEPIPSGVTMYLADMNGAGDVIGSTHRHGGIFSPFLYRNHTIIDLNSMISLPEGRRLTSVSGMNDAGYIVGVVSTPSTFGDPRGVVLVPAAPAAPAGVTATLNAGLVTLNWQESLGALDYLVEAGTTSGASNVFSGSVGSQRSLTTLAPPGRYYVRIRARNAIGVSPPSVEIIVDVL